jgi:UDP-3-O-[3-hydroxymyristoyl] glucosamine N-acyltransferase
LREPGDHGIYFLASGNASGLEFNHSIILSTGDDDFGGSDNVTIKVEDPQLAFYRLMEAMLTGRERPVGVHPTAIIDDAAQISPEAYIGPYCVLGECRIADGVHLHSHVVVMDGSSIEKNVTIEPHSTIGATGVAWIWNPASRQRVVQPQIGYTLIGANSFLGSDITVVRGSVNETTTIGQGCVIAHGSKIGHGCRVGDECHFANNVSVAGNVTLGEQCFLSSGAVVRSMIRLAPGTIVGAGAVVVSDNEERGALLMGVPAKPADKKSEKFTAVPKPLEFKG